MTTKNFIKIETTDIEEMTRIMFISAVKESSNDIYCNQKLYDFLKSNGEYQAFLHEVIEGSDIFGVIGNVRTHLDENMENDVPKFVCEKNTF